MGIGGVPMIPASERRSWARCGKGREGSKNQGKVRNKSREGGHLDLSVGIIKRM